MAMFYGKMEIRSGKIFLEVRIKFKETEKDMKENIKDKLISGL